MWQCTCQLNAISLSLQKLLFFHLYSHLRHTLIIRAYVLICAYIIIKSFAMLSRTTITTWLILMANSNEMTIRCSVLNKVWPFTWIIMRYKFFSLAMSNYEKCSTGRTDFSVYCSIMLKAESSNVRAYHKCIEFLKDHEFSLFPYLTPITAAVFSFLHKSSINWFFTISYETFAMSKYTHI